jgi:hypothetical protein
LKLRKKSEFETPENKEVLKIIKVKYFLLLLSAAKE